MPSSKRRLWTPAELKELRQLAKAGTSVRAIARKLRRSVSAIYQRGSVARIRFTANTRARRKR